MNVDPRFGPTQGASAPPPEARSDRQRARFFSIGRAKAPARFTGSSQRETGLIGESGRGFRGGHGTAQTWSMAYLSSATWQTCFGFRPFDLLQALFGRLKFKRETRRRIGFARKPVPRHKRSSARLRARLLLVHSVQQGSSALASLRESRHASLLAVLQALRHKTPSRRALLWQR